MQDANPQNELELELAELKPKFEKKEEQYNSVRDQYLKLKNRIQVIENLDRIGQGSMVLVKIGTGKAAEEFTGSVLAVKAMNNGYRRFKVCYGPDHNKTVSIVSDKAIQEVIEY